MFSNVLRRTLSRQPMRQYSVLMSKEPMKGLQSYSSPSELSAKLSYAESRFVVPNTAEYVQDINSLVFSGYTQHHMEIIDDFPNDDDMLSIVKGSIQEVYGDVDVEIVRKGYQMKKGKLPYQPSVLKRKRSFGFLSRLRSRSGRKVLLRRRRKGRKSLSV